MKIPKGVIPEKTPRLLTDAERATLAAQVKPEDLARLEKKFARKERQRQATKAAIKKPTSDLSTRYVKDDS